MLLQTKFQSGFQSRQPFSLDIRKTPVVPLGLYRDSGKENGNYRDYRGYIEIIGYILGLYWEVPQ